MFVHEFGHFITAKKIGVYVNEFAIGMGPKIYSFKRKNKNDPTEYSIRLLPIGGFCAMAGEVIEDEDNKNEAKSTFEKLRRLPENEKKAALELFNFVKKTLPLFPQEFMLNI